MAIECFKILNKLSPSCLHDLVVFKDCKYNFRYSNIVDIPRVRVSVFYADWKSKMAAIAGHRLTLDPMGKCSNAFFSETTNMIKAKLYMNVHC
jgi:hypothetical protein